MKFCLHPAPPHSDLDFLRFLYVNFFCCFFLDFCFFTFVVDVNLGQALSATHLSQLSAGQRGEQAWGDAHSHQLLEKELSGVWDVDL